MSDQNTSENLENLAKTDPEAFLNYWRGTLSAEEYAAMLSTAWTEHMQRNIWRPNPVYRRLHLKAGGTDLNELLETQIERGLRGEHDDHVVAPEVPGWFEVTVNRIAPAFGLPAEQIDPKDPGDTPPA
jgi:hypothetical protein